eukprot:TRINITY_DN9249_c0_g2_i1.p1 TRINITY_DN9249_c0_g2~~TRINITY_DN9249_c0_g2_i1.p1  ORF type:complete len:243 (-),score=62.23 TRINITY_DN9249_c0_g2_i1:192-920(-)
MKKNALVCWALLALGTRANRFTDEDGAGDSPVAVNAAAVPSLLAQDTGNAGQQMQRQHQQEQRAEKAPVAGTVQEHSVSAFGNPTAAAAGAAPDASKAPAGGGSATTAPKAPAAAGAAAGATLQDPAMAGSLANSAMPGMASMLGMPPQGMKGVAGASAGAMVPPGVQVGLDRQGLPEQDAPLPLNDPVMELFWKVKGMGQQVQGLRSRMADLRKKDSGAAAGEGKDEGKGKSQEQAAGKTA